MGILTHARKMSPHGNHNMMLQDIGHQGDQGEEAILGVKVFSNTSGVGLGVNGALVNKLLPGRDYHVMPFLLGGHKRAGVW